MGKKRKEIAKKIDKLQKFVVEKPFYIKNSFLLGLEGYDKDNQVVCFRNGVRRPIKDVMIEFLDNFIECGGNVYLGLAKLGLQRGWFRLFATFPEFKEAFYDAKEAVIDYVEFSLFQQAMKGDPKALKLFLETKAKDRGFGKSPISEEEMDKLEDRIKNIRKRISEVIKGEVVDVDE